MQDSSEVLIHDLVRGIAWAAEGLDMMDRPEGKWVKALIATATQIHTDRAQGIERSDDEVWNAVSADVREGYQGDRKRLVADVRRTMILLDKYAVVFREPKP